MTDEHTREAYDQAETVAGSVPGLLEGLAEKLGASLGAGAVFGEPVREGGRTVIPVAQAMMGTGAGGGSGPASAAAEGSGMGGGGGAISRPVGFIEVTAESATFVPLRQPWSDARLVFVYTLLALVVARTLVKLIRG
jgi:uncharacterized spore protein YtfJ